MQQRNKVVHWISVHSVIETSVSATATPAAMEQGRQPYDLGIAADEVALKQFLALPWKAQAPAESTFTGPIISLSSWVAGRIHAATAVPVTYRLPIRGATRREFLVFHRTILQPMRRAMTNINQPPYRAADHMEILNRRNF